MQTLSNSVKHKTDRHAQQRLDNVTLTTVANNGATQGEVRQR